MYIEYNLENDEHEKFIGIFDTTNLNLYISKISNDNRYLNRYYLLLDKGNNPNIIYSSVNKDDVESVLQSIIKNISNHSFTEQFSDNENNTLTIHNKEYN